MKNVDFESWFAELPTTCASCDHCIPLNAVQIEELASMGMNAHDLCYARAINGAKLYDAAIPDTSHTCDEYACDDAKVDTLYQDFVRQEALERAIDAAEYRYGPESCFDEIIPADYVPDGEFHVSPDYNCWDDPDYVAQLDAYADAYAATQEDSYVDAAITDEEYISILAEQEEMRLISESDALDSSIKHLL